MNDHHKYLKLVRNRFLFRLGMIRSLPMIWLAGIRVKEIDEEHSITTIRYRYLTKNPFRSIYFACLGMAAELSSGVIAMMYVRNADPKVSMLVTSMQANFKKKAVGKIFFNCSAGKEIASAISETQKTGEGVILDVISIGKDETGDVVAEFKITWSFRRKLL